MNNYWKKRIQAEQQAKKERSETLAEEMDKLYQRHFNELEKEIRAFEQRYAINNHISPSDVKARVSEMDVKAFEDKAKRYVEEKNFSPEANAELSLYNLKMKISRLEMLQYQLDLEMVALTNGEHKLTKKFLNAEYVKTLETQAGLLGKSVLSPKQIGQAAQTTINASYKGAKWSDRVWQRQNALREIVASMTQDYLLKGKNPTAMISQLKKEFKVSTSDAKRLAVTEGARVATEAEKQSYIANGYDEYVFISEPGACDLCKPLDNKTFKVKDMEPGLNAAPMHPHCHCSTAAHFSMSDDEYEKLIEESWHSRYPHMDNVTNEWALKKEISASVNVSNELIKEGEIYKVDGKNVVQDHTNQEHHVAKWFSEKTGKHVDILPRVAHIKRVSSPDYLIDGTFFDLKEIEGSGKNVIDGSSKKAKKQTPNIIFDITKTSLSTEEIMEQINNVYRSGRRGLQTVVVKKGDELLYVLEPNKK